MKKYDILTIFDICADLVVDLGDILPEFGQKEQYVNSFAADLGGSTCIFACQCAKLGLVTTGAGIVGDDIFGHMVKAKFTQSGVDVSNIVTCENIQTGLGLHLKRTGDDRAILTYSGSIGAVKPEHMTDELLKSARHLHIGSYYLLDGVRDALPDILRRAKNFGLSTSLDTNWDPLEKWELPDEMLSYVDIILPNYNEAMLLTNSLDLDGAVKVLAGKTAAAAVKLGAGGAIAQSGATRIKLPAPEIDVADTIGAGDNFDAGFIYAYLYNLPLEKCLQSGIFCGSTSAARPGGIASQATIGELREIL
jgi:sugar/nucleoside kinase (ribokinase family)